MRPAVSLMQVRLHPWTMDETVAEIARRLEAGTFTQHGVVNVAKLVGMQRDAALRNAVAGCDIVNVDGQGVVWGARFLGLDVPERVAGVDLFFELIALAERRGEPVYLLGAKPDVIERAVARLREQHPRLTIAGWHHGYFWEDERAVVEAIRRSGASMLFVAISSPLKETFIHRWRDALGVRFAMGIGGTLDIVAGVTRRAPRWMQRAGLEWFYRLLQEPGRMWKRYVVTNGAFLWLLLKAKARGGALQ